VSDKEQPLLPCLKPPEWDGAEGNVCRLLWEEPQSGHVPYVAFGYDQPHTFEFLAKWRLEELKKSERDVEREAIRNLHLRKTTWQTADVKLGLFKKLRLLVCGDDYLAAEKILDAGFMREAQAKLKATLLAVGIPRRGFLIATVGEQNRQRLGAFAAAVSMQYHRGDSPPITPAVFAVTDGKIVGMLLGGEELGRADAEREAREAEGSPEAPYVRVMAVGDEASGLEQVHVCVGGSSLERLAEAIQGAFQAALQKHLGRAEFGGEIRVVVFAGMTPEAVRIQVRELERHLHGFLEQTQLKTAAGRPVRVSFEEFEGSWPSFAGGPQEP